MKKKILLAALVLSFVALWGVTGEVSAKVVDELSYDKEYATLRKELKQENKEIKNLKYKNIKIKKGKSKTFGKNTKNTIWTVSIDEYNASLANPLCELISIKKDSRAITVTAHKPGIAYVYCLNTKKKTQKIYRIRIRGTEYSDATLGEGDTFQMLCANKKGKTTGFTYTSNNTSVATVNNKGVITAVGQGTTKIVATKKGETYSMTIKVTDFGFYDANGNKLPKLDGGVEALYRYNRELIYDVDDSFWTDVVGVYVMNVTQPVVVPQTVYEGKYWNTDLTTTVGKIQVRGTTEDVVYDYDNMFNYDVTSYSTKMLKDGTVVGGILNTERMDNYYDMDCSICKVKVGDKFYIIETIFDRKLFEMNCRGSVSKVAALAHDSILGDLSAFRMEAGIVPVKY